MECHVRRLNRSTALMQRSRILKLSVIGDPGVGKSSLIKTYIYNQFISKDLKSCTSTYYTQVCLNSLLYRLEISELSTSAQIQDIKLSLPNDVETDCFLLCYAVNNESSLANILKKWVPHLKRYYSTVPILIVATKCDLNKYGDTLSEVQLEPLLMERESNIKAFLHCSALENGTGLEYVFVEGIKAAVTFKEARERSPPYAFV